MNFPDHQKTGALSELDVERLFVSWSWGVGKDRIDSGYDYFVMPDRARHRGNTILVQVKGTANRKRKGTIVAKVSKKRLREYSTSQTPVFIVRVLANNEMYWVHAQAWCRENAGKLDGGGNAGVRFDSANRLEDRAAFEAYLDHALPANPPRDVFADMAERSRLLNSLDPNFGVNIGLRNGAKHHEVYAKTPQAEAKLSFKAMGTPENIERARDAIEFGLPRSFEVQDFTVSGSPLFEEVGASKAAGTIQIASSSRQAAVVWIYPGLGYSGAVDALVIDADLYRGQAGAAIVNEGRDSTLNLSLRMRMDEPIGKIDLGLPDIFFNRPLQEIDKIRLLAPWAEQIGQQGAFYLEIILPKGKVPIGIPLNGETTGFFHYVRTLGRLHSVARFLGSDIRVPKDGALSAEDIGDIDLAYALLKGERRSVSPGPISFNFEDLPDYKPDYEFLCTSRLCLTIFGQPLGEIPIIVQLSGYKLELDPANKKGRIIQGEEAQGWLSYSEHDDVEGKMTRLARVSDETRII